MIDLKQLDISDIELIEFLEAILDTYKVDFKEYGKAHLKRRIRHRMTIAKNKTFDELRLNVIENETAFKGLFKDFSINVTELFRDPEFYKELHNVLISENNSTPLKIWISACASGEEAYSVLIMLDHFGIAVDEIVASDFNSDIINYAAKGEINTSKISEYIKNLKKTGFNLQFEKYFEKKETSYELRNKYLQKITFVSHNLMDRFENHSFDIILCRNVLIYFEKNLQNKVIDNLTLCLKQDGLLCLGSKESLRFTNAFQGYNTINQTHKIYKKK